MSDREQIRARVEAATPGPWAIAPWHANTILMGESEYGYGNATRQSDAEFIAHARADIPFLLSEVDRLEAGIRKLAAEIGEGRASGSIYTYGEVQRRLWVIISEPEGPAPTTTDPNNPERPTA